MPTLSELGHPEFVAVTWYSLSGPAGLQPEIVDSLNGEIAKAMEQPQIKRQIDQETIEVKPMSPTEVTQFMQSEIARWTPMIKQILGDRQQ